MKNEGLVDILKNQSLLGVLSLLKYDKDNLLFILRESESKDCFKARGFLYSQKSEHSPISQEDIFYLFYDASEPELILGMRNILDCGYTNSKQVAEVLKYFEKTKK